MAKGTYTIASDEGAQRYANEVGATVELDLSADEKKALLAAGWLEEQADPEPKQPATTTRAKKEA